MNRPTGDDPMARVVFAALLVGLLVLIACFLWQGEGSDVATRPAGAATAEDRPWPADHPILSGVVAGGVVLLGGRLYVFMRRLEDR